MAPTGKLGSYFEDMHYKWQNLGVPPFSPTHINVRERCLLVESIDSDIVLIVATQNRRRITDIVRAIFDSFYVERFQ